MPLKAWTMKVPPALLVAVKEISSETSVPQSRIWINALLAGNNRVASKYRASVAGRLAAENAAREPDPTDQGPP